MNRAIYPGTFDPITHGHTDIIERASRIFDEVIIAIAENPTKNTLFPLDRRVELAKLVLAEFTNVTITGFNNLLIEFAKECEANIIIRGIRAVTDFEFEFQLAGMNRKLDESIETIFMMPGEQHAYVSSTLVREIASFEGDVSAFVHPEVANALAKYY